jgi:hypothetical protein
MIELLHGARWLDLVIRRKLGAVYNALLGIGLIGEIVRHLQEARELHAVGLIRTGFAVALFVVLLLHQLAELAEHVDRRSHRSEQAR